MSVLYTCIQIDCGIGGRSPQFNQTTIFQYLSASLVTGFSRYNNQEMVLRLTVYEDAKMIHALLTSRRQVQEFLSPFEAKKIVFIVQVLEANKLNLKRLVVSALSLRKQLQKQVSENHRDYRSYALFLVQGSTCKQVEELNVGVSQIQNHRSYTRMGQAMNTPSPKQKTTRNILPQSPFTDKSNPFKFNDPMGVGSAKKQTRIQGPKYQSGHQKDSVPTAITHSNLHNHQGLRNQSGPLVISDEERKKKQRIQRTRSKIKRFQQLDIKEYNRQTLKIANPQEQYGATYGNKQGTGSTDIRRSIANNTMQKYGHSNNRG